MEVVITADNAGPDRIALAGKALQEIRNLAARMGGRLLQYTPAKINVSGEMIYIHTDINFPVSSLTEYIAQEKNKQ